MNNSVQYFWHDKKTRIDLEVLMFRSKFPHLIFFVTCAFIIAVSPLIFHGRIFSWVSDYTATLLSPISQKISSGVSFFTTGITRIDTIKRVRELEDTNKTLTAALVNQDQLRMDVEFYRSAAQLRERFPSSPIVAGIFSYTRAGGVQQAVLNRGTTDGVARGDVVITAHEELLGVVEQAFSDHAIVRILGDSIFEVTARVANSTVAGLIRSESGGKVILDLVQKNEQISEGALIVTSGDDRFPAGLIIGTVRSIDSEAVGLFQIVRVTPALGSRIGGTVLVIRP